MILFFLTIFITRHSLAENVKEQPSAQDIIVEDIVQNISEKPEPQKITRQPISQHTTPPIAEVDTGPLTFQDLTEEKRPLDKLIIEQQSNLDISWKSLVKDVKAEPIVQDVTWRHRSRNVTSQSEAHNFKEKQLVDKVKSQQSPNSTGPEHRHVISQSLARNVPGPPEQDQTLQPKVQQVPMHLVDKSSILQSVEGQPKIQDKIKHAQPQNASERIPFIQEIKILSDFEKIYKDSQLYKNSMPPVQTNEQWNTTNWQDDINDAIFSQDDIEKYMKVQSEIMNATTTCEEFLNNTVFDVEKVLDVDWHTFYFWNTRDEDPFNMRFSRPSEWVVHRFKEELDKEIKPPVNWSNAEIFLETTVDYSALFVKANVPGLYRAVPGVAFQYHGIPVLNFALKLVEEGYLGIVNCKSKQCYALADVNKMPPVEKFDKAAQTLGFYSVFNQSFAHAHTPNVKDLQEEDPDDMIDYDTMNVDPLQVNIF